MEISNILANIVNQHIKSGYAFAEVTAFTGGAPRTCTIKLSGSTSQISNIRYMSQYSPTVSDIVLVLILEKDLIIIGKLTP
jgi:hypothetical protein